MTAKIEGTKRDKVRAYWAADVNLSYADVAVRFNVTPRQVRTAVEDLPREGPRAQLAANGAYGAAVREDKTPDGAMRVLKQISIFRAHHGYSPTIRELCIILDLNSTNGMRQHFDRLKERGLITWSPAQARTVLITTKGVEALAATDLNKHLVSP